MTVEPRYDVKLLKEVDLKEPITRAYEAALKNPTIITVSNLQEAWIEWAEGHIKELEKAEAEDTATAPGRVTADEASQACAVIEAAMKREKAKMEEKERSSPSPQATVPENTPA